MADETGIGVPGPSAPATSPEEEATLAEAVHEVAHRRIVDLLDREDPEQLLPCPRCGELVISPDEPGTFAFDLEARERICAACGARRDFVAMVRPEADIGGEG